MGLQLVGLNSKPGRSTVTFMRWSWRGITDGDLPIPWTIVGRVLVMVTAAVCGSTLICESTTTFPRLNGPATAGVTIDRPNGAPW